MAISYGVNVTNCSSDFIEMNMERRSIRRIGNIIGMAWVIPDVIIEIAVVILSIVNAVKYSQGDDTLQNLLLDPMFSVLLQMGLSILIFVPSYAMAARSLGPKKRETRPVIEFGGFKAGLGTSVMLISLGIFMVGNMATSFISQLLTNVFGYTPQGGDFSAPRGIYGTIAFFIVVSVLPALIEEFAMRGVILGTLRPHSQPLAVMASAVIFGLMHGNMVQAPFAFVGGIALGYAALVTRSIWPAVIVHFVNNFMSCLYDILPESLISVFSVFHVMIALLCVLFGLLLLLKYRPRPFAITGEDKLSGGQKAKAFFMAPAMIVALVWTAINMLLPALLQTLMFGVMS